MHIIPVIDLQHGQVVRAERGARHAYRPIRSALCDSSDPVTVARRLAEHCATQTLYVADLDALQGRPAQADVLVALLRALPGVTVWLDGGFATAASAQALTTRLDAQQPGASAQVTPVYGSESLRDPDELAVCFAPPSQALLSLDSHRGIACDAAGIRARPALWPQRLIVMTLDRVGSHEGPDLAALDAVRALAPRASLIGAGGIRHMADVRAAAAAGATAWLVASALHDGLLPPAREGLHAPGPAPARATAPASHRVFETLAP